MNIERFRARYRAQIKPSYRVWRHALGVLALGVAMQAGFLSTLENIELWQLLSVPMTLLVLNVGEYFIHKKLGHRQTRFGKLFYQRHTLDHHSFFSDTNMSYESLQDFRVILFPTYLVLVQGAAALGIWALLGFLDGNIAALVAATWVGGYLLYEVFHALEHLPDKHPLSRLPWIKQMRRLHALHHRRDIMHQRNFNIVFPLTDWLLGTLYWERQQPKPRLEISVQSVKRR